MMNAAYVVVTVPVVKIVLEYQMVMQNLMTVVTVMVAMQLILVVVVMRLLPVAVIMYVVQL